MRKELTTLRNGSTGLWPGVIAVSGLGAGLLYFAAPGSPPQQALTLWFLLVCPGMAFVRLLHLKEAYVQWILAIAVSLTLDAIVGGSMVYNGIWSPAAGLVQLIAISLAGAVLQTGRNLIPNSQASTLPVYSTSWRLFAAVTILLVSYLVIVANRGWIQ